MYIFMMDLRTRLLLAIGGGILLIALIVLGIIFFRKDAPVDAGVPIEQVTPGGEEATPTNDIDQTDPTVGQVPTVLAPIPVTDAEKEALYVRQVARDFTERFLSFSNKNDNKHITDIEELVTATMWDWAKNQTANATDPLFSQTTKVVSTNVESISGDTAIVTIGVQQRITQEKETKTAYKHGRIELMRIGGVWKVDGLFWE